MPAVLSFGKKSSVYIDSQRIYYLIVLTHSIFVSGLDNDIQIVGL